VYVAAQDAEVLQTAESVTPDEETMAQLAAVVGSHCTVFASNDAAVASGMGVVTTRGDKLCAAMLIAN
jgi:hypothetical protein